MREDDSNWFRKWEEELPSAEDLMPLSQSLITPDLAQAFNIEKQMEMELEADRTLKRPRLVWTPQLHKRFVDAVAHLGIKNAVPKTIMQLMSVDGLTRENVASHLQKYRLYLKRMQTNNDSIITSPVPSHFLHPPSDHFTPFLHFTHFSTSPTPPIRQQPSNPEDDGTKILTLFPTADH